MNEMSQSYYSFTAPYSSTKWDSFDGIVVCLPTQNQKDFRVPETLFLPESVRRGIEIYRRKLKYTGKPGAPIHFDVESTWRVALVTPPKPADLFYYLEAARKTLGPLLEGKVREIAVPLMPDALNSEHLVDSFVSAIAAIDFHGPRYKKSPKETPKRKPRLTFITPKKVPGLEVTAERAESVTWGTNLVRRLSLRAGNDLTTSRYVALAQELAKEHRCSVEFFSLDRLAKMQAGAFLAVAQGSEDRGGGILKISYTPEKKTSQKVAFVGKGITFDTGGNNLKTGSHMYGMHGDMAGSAVALALVLLAAREKWAFSTEAFLAITDNVLGPKAFRPNDVVTSLRGKTIEVVDTDAEGRMVLADTLWLASLTKPDLLVDFATLTGACIRAIGKNYSGAYTNRRRLQRKIIRAGRMSGERVWPFPNDPDYGRCLKSDIADIKQCRLTGGVDHIEAGYFLSRFVDSKVPWVHVDLSAEECEDELGHVPSKTTGFGVRFAAQLVEIIFKNIE